MCKASRHRRFDEEAISNPTQWKYARHCIILTLCLFIKLIKSPGQNNVMGASVPFIERDLRLSDSSFAQSFAVGTLAASLLQPIFGRLLDARGVRFCMPIGLLLLAFGLFLLSVARSGSALVPGICIVRACAIGCLEAWPAAAIAIWFKLYRGRANALMQVVGGFPVGLVAAAMQAGDTAFGWRPTFQALIIMLAALAVACAVWLRDKPPAAMHIAVAAAATVAQPPAAAHHPDYDDDEHDEGLPPPPPPEPITPSPRSRAEPPPAGAPSQTMEMISAAACKASPPFEAKTPATTKLEPRGRLQRCYTLLIIYSTVLVATSISGGIDLFTVQMAIVRGGGDVHSSPDVLVEGNETANGTSNSSTYNNSSSSAGSWSRLLTETAATGALANAPTYDVAAFVFVPMGIVVSPACLLSGFLLDRGIAPQTMMSVSTVLSVGTCLAAKGMSTLQGGLLYAVVRGLSSGLAGPCFGVIIPHFFGTRNIGKLMGWQSLFFVLGTCLGSLVLGTGADLFGGDFGPILNLMAVPPTILSVLLLSLRRSTSLVHDS